MRFTDLLRATVLLSAGAATALGAACVVGTVEDPGSSVAVQAVVWWLVAVVIGTALGGRASTTAPIAQVLAQARAATALPEPRPGSTLANRLWPLGLATATAGAMAPVAPQVPGIAAGFAIVWALAWRHQGGAVTAVEERDGVMFWVERTSPLAPVALVRLPGLRREQSELP